MASGNGTKCKTYFGGPRKILHAHWKLRFAYSSHTTFHKDVMWATVNVQNSDWHSSADVWSLFFFLARIFFSVTETAADGTGSTIMWPSRLASAWLSYRQTWALGWLISSANPHCTQSQIIFGHRLAADFLKKAVLIEDKFLSACDKRAEEERWGGAFL